jgi:hypothetical protein
MKNKLLLIGLMVSLLLSSCGIFHKGCGCPHFGVISTEKSVNLKMC